MWVEAEIRTMSRASVRFLRSVSPSQCMFTRLLVASQTVRAIAFTPAQSFSDSPLLCRHRSSVSPLRPSWCVPLPCQPLLRAQACTETSRSNHTREQAAMPPLRYLGDEQLMQRQPDVTEEEVAGQEFAQKLQMLSAAMGHYGGIGIAAPQVGWWKRVFCFGIDGSNPRYLAAAAIPLQFWVNPEIVWSSKETCWMWEGCLSVPGMRGWVERPKEILMKGLNAQGEEIAVKLGGLPSRVAQHELDHLDGILFPSRVPGAEFLVPQASVDARDGWAEDWPSPGSRKTALGELQDER